MLTEGERAENYKLQSCGAFDKDSDGAIDDIEKWVVVWSGGIAVCNRHDGRGSESVGQKG